MTPETVEVHEAQNRLPELVSAVKTGAEIILTQGDIPVARLVPLTVNATPRVAGLHSGVAWLSPDFDEPLPEAFWTE